GSGGLFGVGLGNSKQKHLYLPEPQNDFVFSVICEELGYIRTVLFVIIPFALLILRGFQIAMKLKNRYSALVVMGIMVQVGLQAFFNIGVVTGMLPNTGISLPFFSFGGTALILLLGEMGFVLSASRQPNSIER
ncbi:MAG: FtsW/RodA/SpoVE family cell cycle protein, partial [Clostridia bacterium]|nr:FtsW/RodA/SpoVE family cell cycle protein [Clostridia bacterium]